MHLRSRAIRPRADASICDRRLGDREQLTSWLSQAIMRGAFGRLWEGSFPRYVWYKDGDIVYEGRLINRESGEYKGYPLESDEWPPNISQLYE